MQQCNLEVAFSLRRELWYNLVWEKEAQTMKDNEKKKKHMTLDDRIEIQECLNKGMTFKVIGERIGKNQTTVSKWRSMWQHT